MLLWSQVGVVLASDLFTPHLDLSEELIVQLVAWFVEDCEDSNPYLDLGSKRPRALSTLFCLNTFRISLTLTLMFNILRTG